MLRRIVRFTPCFSIPIFSNEYVHDIDTLNHPTQKNPSTGWERVKKMYSKSEIDGHSVELHNVMQSTMTGTFIGGCIGGFYKGTNAYVNFLENNQATIYRSTGDAKKKLQEYVTMAFCRGVVQWGWRVGIFTFMFSIVTTTVSVYRDDTSLVDYVLAGAITGAVYKANLGLAATFVGAGLGAVIGSIGGLAILGILKLAGVSMQEIRSALYKLKEAREDQMKQAYDKASETTNDELSKYHDHIVQGKGEQKLAELPVTSATT